MIWVALGLAVVALAIAVAAYRRAIGADDTARHVACQTRSWGRRSALLLKRDGPPPREQATADRPIGRTRAARIEPHGR